MKFAKSCFDIFLVFFSTLGIVFLFVYLPNSYCKEEGTCFVCHQKTQVTTVVDKKSTLNERFYYNICHDCLLKILEEKRKEIQ